MKKTLITLGMGACVLVAFSSCQSTDGDGYFSSEEAVPMSEFGEMTVADGEIPPWLLEDTGDTPQIDAGTTTHRRENFLIPEPGESLADSSGSASSSQNQPELAHNDVTIETNPNDIVVDPGEVPGGNPVIAPATGGTPAISTPKPTPSVKKPAPKKATAKKKPAKRVTAPTLVTYKVKKGDNLSEIARRSGTTVAAIRKASGIKGDLIYAGSTIKVPFTPKGYKGSKGSSKPTTYTVKKGDTVSGIAAKNGLTTAALLKANGMSMKQASRIRPGQKLSIPAKATKASSKSSSKKKSSKKRSRRR